MRYGYVRVSTKDQNIARQMSALTDSGIEKKYIYIDKESGKDFNRKNYRRLLKKLKAEDEVYVKSIDRLGRDYDEIIKQWQVITKEKEAHIIVLDFPLLDTRKQEQGLTGKFIADLVLQILSYVAQVERENIHQRQLEGIREAKKRGVAFGRPRKEVSKEFDSVAKEWQRGKLSLREGARLLNTNHMTFERWLKQNGYK
ncbi:recombinase family protein [Porcincola intestinalis]|uniref:Recombinase family protein n=1 Tax=Porcincola intestinalis TaxID=2606632 RepID=A0A6L5X3A0_9FIRM|nr:recombinase family protein [Porcincola intestinalis]MCI6767642.1 recombinase family protein [Lachnospiraceae bacterium]MDD7060496.1 recombinase family protein [Porcincola intestinalis]MDY5282517.1 recombinase family protein [Porcincola intestinalis]MSS13843.1 recombinase family protein [Porcincola intestinalis]